MKELLLMVVNLINKRKQNHWNYVGGMFYSTIPQPLALVCMFGGSSLHVPQRKEREKRTSKTLREDPHEIMTMLPMSLNSDNIICKFIGHCGGARKGSGDGDDDNNNTNRGNPPKSSFYRRPHPLTDKVGEGRRPQRRWRTHFLDAGVGMEGC